MGFGFSNSYRFILNWLKKAWNVFTADSVFKNVVKWGEGVQRCYFFLAAVCKPCC